MAASMTSAAGQAAYRRLASPETVDRLMVGVCGAIWLVLLAVIVVATVALVDLGQWRSRRGGGGRLLVAALQHHRRVRL